jgi:hypothetical protein
VEAIGVPGARLDVFRVSGSGKPRRAVSPGHRRRLGLGVVGAWHMANAMVTVDHDGEPSVFAF